MVARSPIVRDAPNVYKRLRSAVARFISTQRVIEVGDQVVEILDADGKADEGVADAERLALLRWQRGVRHDGGMLDQALDPAQALGQREDLDPLEEAPRFGQAALELDRDHAAVAVHLAPGQLVLWMAGETRIVDAGHLRVARQMLGDRLRVDAMPLQPERQGLQAAQREEAVEGARDGAHRVVQEGQ